MKKIFNLNSKYNIDMFSTVIHSSKVFNAEQKIQGLKKRNISFKALGKERWEV